jgi:hypothetical protein
LLHAVTSRFCEITILHHVQKVTYHMVLFLWVSGIGKSRKTEGRLVVGRELTLILRGMGFLWGTYRNGLKSNSWDGDIAEQVYWNHQVVKFMSLEFNQKKIPSYLMEPALLDLEVNTGTSCAGLLGTGLTR